MSFILFNQTSVPAEQRIALVDCNNFYVSCERLFRPDLWNKPVAVLSNNDGCLVSRSQEVKDLGIKMAIPAFQVRQQLNKHQVQLFSSNYALYADISSRVMNQLSEFTPNIELYSIDEAFLDLTGICNNNPETYALDIKKLIWRKTGIPVCVGMGSNKSLAKLANFVAKKWPEKNGVFDFPTGRQGQNLMQLIPVREVWGIGPRLSKRLEHLHIFNAWDLCRQPPDRMHNLFGITVARTVMELNGTACLSLEEITPPRRQIVCSRSFKHPISRLNELSEAAAVFCSRAAEKLRKQHSLARIVTVAIRTNHFDTRKQQHSCSASQVLEHASQDTRTFTAASKQLLKQLFYSGFSYHKCSILFSEITADEHTRQLDLFTDAYDKQRRNTERALMNTIDQINRRFPCSISLTATGTRKKWQYMPQKLSPRYTTDWNELPRVKCV